MSKPSACPRDGAAPSPPWHFIPAKSLLPNHVAPGRKSASPGGGQALARRLRRYSGGVLHGNVVIIAVITPSKLLSPQ